MRPSHLVGALVVTIVGGAITAIVTAAVNAALTDTPRTPSVDPVESPTAVSADPPGADEQVIRRPGEIRLIRMMMAHPGIQAAKLSLATSVAFSPDDKILASGGADKAVRLWNATNGETIATLSGHRNKISAVAFNPATGELASADADSTVRTWKITDHTAITTATIDTEHRDAISLMAFSPNGKYLATAGTYDGTVRLFDAATHSLTRVFTVGPEWVTSIAFSPDSASFAVGSGNPDTKPAVYAARVWSTSTGQRQVEFKVHENWISGIAFTKDGTRVVTSDHDQRALVWMITNGNVVNEITDIPNGVNCLAVTSGGTLFALAEGTEVSIRDLATGTRRLSSVGMPNPIVGLAFTRHGTKIAAASTDGNVAIWSFSA